MRKEKNMGIQYVLSLLSILGALASPVVFANSPQEILQEYPYLIFDNSGDPELPRNTRSSKSPYKNKQSKENKQKKESIENPSKLPSRLGLDTLNISGSGQFSQTNFKHLIQSLGVKTGYIIDLRQESHGFLDETPVSWFGVKNAENVQRTPDEIDAIENQLIDALNQGKEKETIVYVRTKYNENGEKDENEENGKETRISFTPKKFSFKEASTERTFVQNSGFTYLRIYALDYYPPTDKQIDQFVNFVKNLPPGTWLHFHCHAGIGRTTTFMVLYDMIRNADKVSAKDILLRQALIGGKNFLKVDSTKAWKIPINKARLKLLKTFYQYVQDKEGYAKRSWSEWLVSRPK